MRVDECTTHTSSMTRTRARAPKGERAYYGKVPRTRGKSTTLVASMTHSGMGASMAFEGATDASAAFETYDVEHFLAPTSLKEGQIVVMDRLGAHRGERVRGLIEEKGAVLWFLPSSYSRRTSAL